MASSIFSILLVLLIPLSATAQTNNITLGSSLTADDRNSSWVSPSGEFAFGFREIVTAGYLLSIWFEKIAEKTIVWSANGENGGILAPKGSTVRLTTDGRLVLTGPNQAVIWSRSPDSDGAAYAAILDNGNFVIANQASVNLWETFREPTDTILPTQKLNQGITVTARYSDTNYSSGRFSYKLQSDGNLVFYATIPPPSISSTISSTVTSAVSDAYWSADTVGSGFQVIFNQSGQIFLTARNGSVLNLIIAEAVPYNEFYQRAIIEYDGVFRKYVYPKAANSSAGMPMGWSLTPYPVPPNICTRLVQQIGSGACGFNSLCTLDTNQRPQCQCPPRYTLLDPTNTMNGCIQNFSPQSCSRSMPETDLFDFEEMIYTNWPYNDYAHYESLTESLCREACLVDCFCAVAIFNGGTCWLKKFPLSNGVIDQSVDGKALVKVRKGNTTSKFEGDNQKKNDKSTLITIGSVLLSSSVFLNLLLLLVTYLSFRSFRKKRGKLTQPLQINQAAGTHGFTYQELKEATDDFKEELGRGAYGEVYKGALAPHDGSFVAVKVLNKMTGEGEEEFKREVNAISETNHKNLVKLLGFCNEGQHRLLVYEFMSNGSLADYLFGDSRPSWYKRLEIAYGVARGLTYLHDECIRQIIHCDIKPQNILLDDSLTAKISDFGLAKLLMVGQTRTVTGIRGTKGYLAPEWFRNMPISSKVDVYSFGILLLELICCRKSYEPEVQDEAQIILADWVCDCYREGNLHRLVENDIEALSQKKKIESFVMIAMWCIQEEPSMRPTMKKVTQMLEGTVEVPRPSLPYSFSGSV